jgi:hypothetical protein
MLKMVEGKTSFGTGGFVVLDARFNVSSAAGTGSAVAISNIIVGLVSCSVSSTAATLTGADMSTSNTAPAPNSWESLLKGVFKREADTSLNFSTAFMETTSQRSGPTKHRIWRTISSHCLSPLWKRKNCDFVSSFDFFTVAG